MYAVGSNCRRRAIHSENCGSSCCRDGLPVIEQNARAVPIQDRAGIEFDVERGVIGLNPGADQLLTRRRQPLMERQWVVAPPLFGSVTCFSFSAL